MAISCGTIAQRLERRSIRTLGGCLEWIGPTDTSGYGTTSWTEKLGKRPARVHRVAYELAKGEIPKGMFVCHSCDNRKCIEPSHLWIGTALDNNNDMIKKGRHRFGVPYSVNQRQ